MKGLVNDGSACKFFPFFCQGVDVENKLLRLDFLKQFLIISSETFCHAPCFQALYEAFNPGVEQSMPFIYCIWCM